jgi:hypothetical protein
MIFAPGSSDYNSVMTAHLAGELDNWPTKDEMAAILREAGLGVRVGRYSVRIEDCEHFVFQQYGGDLGDPQIDADADTVDDMVRDGRLVSNALARAGLRHRFEIYDDDVNPDTLAAYLHYGWPLQDSGESRASSD